MGYCTIYKHSQFSILTTVGGSSQNSGFGYRGLGSTNNSGKTTYLSPHMGIVLPPGLSLASGPAAHGSGGPHAPHLAGGGQHNSIINANQVMRTRSPHSKYRGPQGTITFQGSKWPLFTILFLLFFFSFIFTKIIFSPIFPILPCCMNVVVIVVRCLKCKQS